LPPVTDTELINQTKVIPVIGMEGVCKVIGVAGLLKEKYVRTRPQFVTPWTHESLFLSKGT